MIKHHRALPPLYRYPYPWILLMLLGLTSIPNFSKPYPDNFACQKRPFDAFDPSLVKRIQSVDDLLSEVEAQGCRAGAYTDLEKLEILVHVVEKRFYHGYSYYSMGENWITALAGRYMRNDVGAIVDPDDLLKHPMAACSQVCLVIMDALQKMNIPYRKVCLRGHFCMEAFIGDKWYFIDANIEPDFSRIGGRKSLDEIIKANQLFTLYRDTRLDSADIAKMFALRVYGKENVFPAPRALLFQKVTYSLSKWFWTLPLVLLILYHFKSREC